MINKTIVLLFYVLTGLNSVSAQFVHPGLTNKLSDLDRVKYMVESKINPWYTSYQEMLSDSKSSYDYNVRGDERFTELGRDDGTNYSAWNDDIRAAYYNALQWYVTGDSRHAEKSIEIFNAWKNLEDVTSGGTQALSGAIVYIMLEAAEIIKSTYTGWSASDIQDFKDMLVYPGYSTTAEPSGISRTSGSFYWQAYQGDSVRHGNQGLAGFRAVMAMGIFMDNEIMYERALRYLQGLPHRPDDLPYPAGPPKATSISNVGDYEDTYNFTVGTSIEDFGYNEVITNYIYENGQCQESSRDQQHTFFGIGNICAMAEMAWSQGDDLYSHVNDRLLLGLEYTAKYNASYLRSYPDQKEHWIPTVASGEFSNRFNASQRVKAKMISPTHLGGYRDARPILEMPLAHYYGRGFKTADEVLWTTRARDLAIEETGYEAAGHQNGAIGWGALTSRRPDGCYGEPINGFDSNGLPSYAMHVLPGTIEAEHFDYSPVSGEGRTYHDTSVSNGGNVYRTNESVGIESEGAGDYHLTNIEDGEWLTYTVYVPSNGTYNIAVNYAAANANGSMKFNFNGEDVGGDLAIPFGGENSTGLNDWKDFTIANGVLLSKGVQSLKVLFNGENNSFELNNITISLVALAPESSILIQAEDYIAMEEVKKEPTEDVDGGLNIGYIDTGDWMEYDVDVSIAGTYFINYRVASKKGGSSVEFLVDGVSNGITDIASTNGWQNWTTVTTKASFSLGSHRIRLNVTGGGFNINWFELVLDEQEALSQDDFDVNNNVSFYPNPVSDNLRVLMPSLKFNKYTVCDIKGRVRESGAISGALKELNINFNDASKGVYIITLKGDRFVEVFKLIKI